MDFKERVYKVLIVSASKKLNTSLKELFCDSRYCPVSQADSLSCAKRRLSEQEYDFIIVNSPLPDGDGLRFSIDVCSGKSAVVMLLVRNDVYESVFGCVSPYGVYTLPKPLSKQIIIQGLDWMTASRERLRRLERKTISLEEKMQEIRLVNRAKWLLITELKMAENDAHSYIEKQAMDRCVSKKEIAEEIIKNYS